MLLLHRKQPIHPQKGPRTETAPRALADDTLDRVHRRPVQQHDGYVVVKGPWESRHLLMVLSTQVDIIYYGRMVIVGVVGAGTMGAGIAQAAAQAGFEVVLYDIEETYLDRGRRAIGSSLQHLVERGHLADDERDQVLRRLTCTASFGDLAHAQLAIEAVPETLSLKLEVFGRLSETCAPDAILASNTSSLSLTEIGSSSGRAERVVGMHFFNPPARMKLVEVVRGEATDPEVVEATVALARAMGKTPVVCRDTPGFIVNRVARPFYLESLYMLGDGLADIPTIDAAMRGVGFPMGPFQLMDLIGLDVNFAVTSSVYQQRFHEPRFRPHAVQEGLVRAGRLGRKTGSGFYDYSTDPATPSVRRDSPPRPGPPFEWDRWQAQTPDPEVAPLAARTLAALVNEAYFALGEGVASEVDIDAAMQLGTNYPRGLIAWGRDIGLSLVLDTVLALEDWYRDGRHIPAPLLREQALV